MPINNELLRILCCPVTKVPVRVLPHDQVLLLNEQIAQGVLMYANGRLVEDPVEEALITTDKRIIYRVEDGIPMMLVEMGIPTSQTKNP
jgi:uncharacterized protein YbaR (Trm112 family)